MSLAGSLRSVGRAMLISDSDIANYAELVDPLRESSRTSIAIDEKGS